MRPGFVMAVLTVVEILSFEKNICYLGCTLSMILNFLEEFLFIFFGTDVHSTRTSKQQLYKMLQIIVSKSDIIWV